MKSGDIQSQSRIHLVLAENAHASTWCLVSGHYDAADQENINT